MLYCIEGNIGSGKSTLLNTLKLHYNHIVVKEPIDAWKHWLDNSSSDKEFFQCIVLVWYIIVARKYKKTKKSVFVERSPFTAKHVFAPSAFTKGNTHLNQLHDRLYAVAEKEFTPKAYVFLSTTPSTCLKRLRSRNQSGDSNVTLHYLKKLDMAHWQSIQHLHQSNVTVLTIDELL